MAGVTAAGYTSKMPVTGDGGSIARLKSAELRHPASVAAASGLHRIASSLVKGSASTLSIRSRMSRGMTSILPASGRCRTTSAASVLSDLRQAARSSAFTASHFSAPR